MWPIAITETFWPQQDICGLQYMELPDHLKKNWLDCFRYKKTLYEMLKWHAIDKIWVLIIDMPHVFYYIKISWIIVLDNSSSYYLGYNVILISKNKHGIISFSLNTSRCGNLWMGVDFMVYLIIFMNFPYHKEIT